MDSFRASFTKKHSNTVHGGSVFLQQFGTTSSVLDRAASSTTSTASSSTLAVDSSAIQTLLPIDWGSALHAPASLDAKPDDRSWTVHDGNFFASAVNKHQPRELGERRLIGEARAERVTWHKQRRSGDTPDRLRRILPGGGAAPAAAVAGPQCVPVIAPVPVARLGEGALDLRGFTQQGSVGMGQFASVHRALRDRDKLHVALKRWHRPVALARPGSAARVAPGSGEDGPVPCDDEDVACFEQEVAVHHACAARPIDGLVKFIGYGFSEDGRTPEVRGHALAYYTLLVGLALTDYVATTY